MSRTKHLNVFSCFLIAAFICPSSCIEIEGEPFVAYTDLFYSFCLICLKKYFEGITFCLFNKVPSI